MGQTLQRTRWGNKWNGSVWPVGDTNTHWLLLKGLWERYGAAQHDRTDVSSEKPRNSRQSSLFKHFVIWRNRCQTPGVDIFQLTPCSEYLRALFWGGDRFHSVTPWTFIPPRFQNGFKSPKSWTEVTFLEEEEKKDKPLPTPDSPVSPSSSTPLSSQVSCCTPVSSSSSFVRGFHSEPRRGSVVSVRNYAPVTVRLCSAGRTRKNADGSRTTECFSSDLLWDMRRAPSLFCQITLLGSPRSAGLWRVFSAIWWPHYAKWFPPHTPLHKMSECEIWYVWKRLADSVESQLTIFLP